MKKIISVIVCVLLVFVMISGCNQNEVERPVAVCIIIGPHGNSKKLDYHNEIVRNVVLMAARTYGYVSVVCVDGNPDLVAKGSLDIKNQYKNADSAKLEADANTRTISILNDMDNYVADDPEVDTLAAFNLGVKSFSEAPSNAVKVIIVIDTGFCTTGLLDFHNNLINAEPNAIADALAEKKAIPNLDGIEVKFQFADVSYPQEKLSNRQSEQLKAIWEAIVIKGGGTFEAVDTAFTEEYEDKEFPTVSPIQLEKEQPIKFDSTMLNSEANPFTEPTFLYEEQVRFVADSDSLAKPELADKAINPIADYMNTNPEFRILLIGTTAGDGVSEYALNLSNSRANRIKEILIEKGVSEERIVTLGMGGNDPWHIYNVGISGELAAQNRKVVLLDADSEMAKELIK